MRMVSTMTELELADRLKLLLENSKLREIACASFMDACDGDLHTMLEELLKQYLDYVVEFDHLRSRVERAGEEAMRVHAAHAISILEPVLRSLEQPSKECDDAVRCHDCHERLLGPQNMEWCEPSGEYINEDFWWCPKCGRKER